MYYWGGILGVLFGYLVGGPLGAILGLWIGHLFEHGINQQREVAMDRQHSVKSQFLEATFSTLGHLSKAKGMVTRGDIKIAQAVMERFQLRSTERREAQQAFRRGKLSNFPLRIVLRNLRMACTGRSDLLQMFLEIQLQVAVAEDCRHSNVRELLYIISDELALGRWRLDSTFKMFSAKTNFNYEQSGYRCNRGNRGYGYESRGPKQFQRGTVEGACRVLGVQVGDSPVTIKRAYRKLMNEHHPDKLASRGLPPSKLEIANQTTQNIQAAFNLLKKEKNFR